MPPSGTRRMMLVKNVFGRSISHVSKPVDAQTLAEAFPYASPQMLDALAEQTKNLFSHYANGRWTEFAEAASFEDLCNQFDLLESEAIERIQAGVKPVILYRSAHERQEQTNEKLQVEISKQIKEIERLEAEIKSRVGQIQSTADQWKHL